MPIKNSTNLVDDTVVDNIIKWKKKWFKKNYIYGNFANKSSMARAVA